MEILGAIMHTLKDIIHEWKRMDSSDEFHDYLLKWYTPIYDHACNFVGYKRSGENENCYS